jgi:20S proteasome alpha/beta subunit
VTLCIAAECVFGREERIILASDYRSETELIGVENETKVGWIDEKTAVLIAGNSSRANELIMVCSNIAEDAGSEKSSTYDILQRAVTMQKQNIADQYIGSKLGMDYETFLKRGSNLPPDVFRQLTVDITNLHLDCFLIVATISDNVGSSLMRVHDTGTVEICNNFCAIGSGYYIAESILALRGHQLNLPLKKALYNVHEAMTLGAHAPGVGEDFQVSILSLKGDAVEWEYLTFEYFEYLEKQEKKYGIREITKIDYNPKWVKKVRR